MDTNASAIEAIRLRSAELVKLADMTDLVRIVVFDPTERTKAQALDTLSHAARTPAGRSVVLEAMQQDGAAFEAALAAVPFNADDRSLHRAMAILLARLSQYNLAAVDLVDFMGSSASAALQLVTSILADATLVPLELALVPAFSRVLYELMLPCSYSSASMSNADLDVFPSELQLRAHQLMAGNLLNQVLMGPLFRHLSAALLNVYTDSRALLTAMGHVLSVIESCTLLLKDTPLRHQFVQHVAVRSGVLHESLIPYFLALVRLHPISAAAHPLEPTWFQYKDPTTRQPYYYNAKTHESRWQLPPGNCVAPARTIQRHAEALTKWLRVLVSVSFSVASIHTTAHPVPQPYLVDWVAGLCDIVLTHALPPAAQPLVLFFLEHSTAFHYFLALLINVDALASETYNASNRVARLLAAVSAPLDTRTRFHAKAVLANKKGLHVLRDRLSFTLVLGLLQAPEVYFMANAQEVPQPRERWDQYTGDDGHSIYYYNVTTHESVWVLPPSLPRGWMVVWCEDYQQGYFYHLVTRSSTWERPSSEPEPPCAVHDSTTTDASFTAYSQRVMLEWVATAMQFRGRRRSLAATGASTAQRSASVVVHEIDFPGLSRLHAPKLLPPLREKKDFQAESLVVPGAPAATTDAVPDRFLCPINKTIMLHPVFSPETQLTYEHQAIVERIQDGAGVCPVTQQPVDLAKLAPNEALAREIRGYQAILLAYPTQAPS
ncbi:hypothetical protein ACHHYP_07464 [Achlya hypogyna]|uniref:U-box domain-containing protein n=1 Tax=Achlya hypogyna TaxID=1202772 RepID=A0A1V9ZLZ2_ACHHY|nr:hypothetical protein ACHHYP_07464 [Achlya hypogyna]